MRRLIEKELTESASVIGAIDPTQVEAIASALITVFKNGGKAIFFGNGGSASDAQHLAAELAGRYMMERPALNGVSLSSLSAITAIGNDYSYDRIFVRQIEACVQKGDAVIGLSTSGNSKNVILAIERAKELGAITIGFSGTAGKLREIVDLPLTIPSKGTPHIQEGYMAAGHVICDLIEKGVFGKRAVFIDRDDTIARDVPYCSRPEDMHLFDGVGISIKRLNEAGFLVVVVTNQSGIGRGYFTEDMLTRIHEKMRADLAADGAVIDAIYYCPHHPDDKCACRKPGTVMIEKAIKELAIDPSRSYVIGDGDHDIIMGEKMGCFGFKVGEGLTFNDAVERILKKG